MLQVSPAVCTSPSGMDFHDGAQPGLPANSYQIRAVESFVFCSYLLAGQFLSTIYFFFYILSSGISSIWRLNCAVLTSCVAHHKLLQC